MTAQTILYLVLAVFFALAISLYMYGFKSKLNPKLRIGLGVLRFLTLCCLGILLVNPTITNTTLTVQKPSLAVLVDNSESIKVLEQDVAVKDMLANLQSNSAINDRFNVQYYTVGEDFGMLDSLIFDAKNTNLTKGLTGLKGLYKNQVSPTIVLTDGNQTLGTDYVLAARTYGNEVYPVVLGDTIAYEDVQITRLNANKYAYHKNEFPVEATLVYSGENERQLRYTLSNGGQVVYSQNINFGPENRVVTLAVNLPANAIGLQRYAASVAPISNEKNTTNNQSYFAVEVIDQATNILVVSSMSHPDIGALKKAFTSVEQRRLSIAKPAQALEVLNDYQLVILYQPNPSFRGVFENLVQLNKNYWVFAGMQTDWLFLNSIQNNYAKENTGVREDVSALVNRSYSKFAIDNFEVAGFPPLQTQLGDVVRLAVYDELLSQTIRDINTDNPLFFSIERDGVRSALWDGEGIWKWRAQSYLDQGSFTDFDNFLGSMVQYLSSNKRKSRLTVSHETFYYNNSDIIIDAQYFNDTYVFDPGASLVMTVRNQDNSVNRQFPMLLTNSFYRVNLNGLEAGDYSFTVSVSDSGIARSGNFTIVAFSSEQQFSGADVTKLRALSQTTEGKLFASDQIEQLASSLLADSRYVPIQKSKQNIVPLIDWKMLLGLLAILLAIEWFTRKYNGLI
ncbi:MAG: VWA domain-containing protein [Gilvibacter sp.]